MRFLFLILLVGCCVCPEPDYTGWQKVPNPFYRDYSEDSIWTYIKEGDCWLGTFDSTIYRFQIQPYQIIDTIK